MHRRTPKKKSTKKGRPTLEEKEEEGLRKTKRSKSIREFRQGAKQRGVGPGMIFLEGNH